MFLQARMIPPQHGSLSYFKSLSLPNRLFVLRTVSLHSNTSSKVGTFVILFTALFLVLSQQGGR